MKCMPLAHLLLLSSVAFGGNKPALCELASKSVVGHPSSGVAQVSNVGDIQIRCGVPARPFPKTPGASRNGLIAATTVYKISPDGTKRFIPSEVHQLGGGTGGIGHNQEVERVDFYVQIRLGSREREAEVRKYVAKLEKSMAPEQITEKAHQRALNNTREFFYQNRVGHFQVECRVMDGDRLMGVGVVELEVLFKGRFSDVGLPSAPPV